MSVEFYRINPDLGGSGGVAVPQITQSNFSVSQTFNSVAEALTWFTENGHTWDFENLWLVPNSTIKGYMLNLGFPLVISIDEISSNTQYVLENGSYIIKYGTNYVNFYTADNTLRNQINVTSYTAISLFPSRTLSDAGLSERLTISTVSATSFRINGSSSYQTAPEPILLFYEGLMPVGEDTDPYAPGGDSVSGGGTGNFDGTGDDIGIPALPTLSAVDTGFITLFNPTAGQLKSLANYMWSSGFDLNTFKKLFADPMDCILGLSIVPVAVPNGGSKAVSIGNISTGVSMTTASGQYVEVDCGTLNVNEYWGAYLDYAPFTKAEIYLPYIGTHPINVDDIMNKAVHVVYHVDILSGACTAFVKCGGSVLYEFIGQCSSSIPITGNDWTNVINGVLSIAGAIGTMVATGGASAPLSAGAIASTAVNSLKPTVEKSGSMSGTGGMLAVQTPYLILTRPRQARPAKQNEYTGYPSFITSKLSSLSGYTEIEKIHLEGISGTEQELSEIEGLLKTGVII